MEVTGDNVCQGKWFISLYRHMLYILLMFIYKNTNAVTVYTSQFTNDKTPSKTLARLTDVSDDLCTPDV